MTPTRELIWRRENIVLSPSCMLSIAIGSILFICCLLDKEPLMSAISIISFAAYLVFILWNKGELIIKYFAFIFAVIANIAGCAIIEFAEISLPELGTTSYFSGSLPLLVLSRWIFLLIIFGLDIRLSDRIQTDAGIPFQARKNYVTILSGVLLVVSVLLFLQVAPVPSFVVRANSFFYAQEYGVAGMWEAIAHAMSYAMVIPAMAIRQGNRGIGIAGIAVYFLYLFWTGNKFTNFLVSVALILIVFYDVFAQREQKLLRKAVVWCACLMAAMLIFSLFAYSMTSNNKPIDYFNTRMVQQGQLWWGTYNLQPQSLHAEDFSYEFSALIDQKEGAAQNVGSHNGIYGIMYATAPKATIDAKLATGSQYTEAGYAAAYYYFGPVGAVLFSVIMGLIVAVFTNGLIRAVAHDSPITACVYTRFLVISMTALSMFLFIGFFDFLSILSFAYLLITGLAFRARERPPKHFCRIDCLKRND